MSRQRQDGLIFLLMGSLLFVGFGCLGLKAMGDYRTVYYSARCLLEGRSPWAPAEVERVYLADAAQRAIPDPIPPDQNHNVARFVYFPGAFLVTAPMAVVPWGPSHLIWMVLLDAGLILAVFLLWRVVAEPEARMGGALGCLLLVTSVCVPIYGNAGALVVFFCAAAVVCFLRKGPVAVGVVCLALGLLLKPQDAGPIWLYFLLAGGVHRRRALQTALVFVALSLPGTLWVTHVSPHWMHELHTNLASAEMRGELSDPRPDVVTGVGNGMIISLQSVFSVFWSDPRVFVAASWAVCAPLLLVWGWITVRARFSEQRAWLALAVMAALSMLPTYHRPHDARMLVLAIPACALLWARGDRLRWLGTALTAAGLCATSEILIVPLRTFTEGLHLNSGRVGDRLLNVALSLPGPLLLLATGVFFLWVYSRAVREEDGLGGISQAAFDGNFSAAAPSA